MIFFILISQKRGDLGFTERKWYLRTRREINHLFLFVFMGTKIRIQAHSKNGNKYSYDVSLCERVM
ncbi:hypothetical protein Hanom_Chr07g00656481 [Helianthus anomalus]